MGQEGRSKRQDLSGVPRQCVASVLFGERVADIASRDYWGVRGE